jgi:pimeloyl-ACP methyl ester carboxylesterase
MAHGLAGVKEMRLDAYATKFSEAGYKVLVFDYRHFGESEGLPRQLLSIKKQHQDWLAAISYISKETEIEDSKIILWGSSLSGGHVVEIANQIPTLAAVVSQVPHVNGISSAMAGNPLTNLRLTSAAVKDYIGSLFGRPPIYVNACGEPGDLALMTGAGEKEGYLKLVPENFSFNQKVSARFVLSLVNYHPGRQLKSLVMPTLIQVGLRDVTTPSKKTIKYCNRNNNIKVKSYDLGHFSPYVDPDFSTFINDQISFLNKITNVI